MPHERELDVALAEAREAGAAVRHYYETGTEVWEKSEDNPLTQADLESDRIIARNLRGAFPSDGLLSEETTDDRSRLSKRRVWIVDPMDGTKEFTQKITEFCVSIALVEEGEPVVGVAFNPAADVAVWARRGGGTFRDGERVQVSGCATLEDAIVIASRTEISRDKFRPTGAGSRRSGRWARSPGSSPASHRARAI